MTRGGIRTLNYRITRRVLYCCATTAALAESLEAPSGVESNLVIKSEIECQWIELEEPCKN